MTAAAALRHFWRTDNFAADIQRRADLLANSLEQIVADHDVPLKIKGRGMMLGIDTGSGKTAAAITRAAFQNGLIIETSGADDEVVKVLAPLTIEDDVFAAGLGILREAFQTVLSETRFHGRRMGEVSRC